MRVPGAGSKAASGAQAEIHASACCATVCSCWCWASLAAGAQKIKPIPVSQTLIAGEPWNQPRTGGKDTVQTGEKKT